MQQLATALLTGEKGGDFRRFTQVASAQQEYLAQMDGFWTNTIASDRPIRMPLTSAAKFCVRVCATFRPASCVAFMVLSACFAWAARVWRTRSPVSVPLRPAHYMQHDKGKD
jgi:hypothetical protein